jgi:hypothetical protein
MPPPILIFRNEINALGDFRGGVKVARDFAIKLVGQWEQLALEADEEAKAR